MGRHLSTAIAFCDFPENGDFFFKKVDVRFKATIACCSPGCLWQTHASSTRRQTNKAKNIYAIFVKEKPFIIFVFK